MWYMWQFWAPGNPRSNGLHGVHHQGEPGSRGPRIGSVRLGLPTAGSPFWKQEVVSAEPNSLLDELHSTVFCSERCELCFATTHSERECAQNGDRDPDVGDRLRNLEATVLAIARPAVPRSMGSDVPRPIRPSCRK